MDFDFGEGEIEFCWSEDWFHGESAGDDEAELLDQDDADDLVDAGAWSYLATDKRRRPRLCRLPRAVTLVHVTTKFLCLPDLARKSCGCVAYRENAR